MATNRELKVVAVFSGDDTRILTIPDPRGGLTRSDFDALEADAEVVLIGDREGAVFTGLRTAYYVDTTTDTLQVDAS